MTHETLCQPVGPVCTALALLSAVLIAIARPFFTTTQMLVSIVSVRKTRGRELFQLFIERFQHLAWTRLKTSGRCEELTPTSVRLNVDPFCKCVMKLKEVPEPVLER